MFLPAWVDALPGEHPIKAGLYQNIAAGTATLHCIRQLAPYLAALQTAENVESAGVERVDLGQGWRRRRSVCPGSYFTARWLSVLGCISATTAILWSC